MEMRHLLYLATCLFLLNSCTKENIDGTPSLKPELPEVAYDYKNITLPFNAVPGLVQINTRIDFINIDPLSNPIFTGGFINNPGGIKQEITDEGATLGRVLFYDKSLSQNNTISCASCHQQKLAFTDGKAFSEGFQGELTERNSMSIINPILQNNLFWDSRSVSILDLSLKPIQNHIEMGMERLDILEEKVRNIDYYGPLFEKAFGDRHITSDRIAVAISQFVSSITSSNSKFDKGQLNTFELHGKQVFLEKCGSCHSGSNFAADDGPGGAYGMNFIDLSSTSIVNLRGTTNIGLDVVSADNGFDGKFRIPTLRNIMLTAPYMHDGRFKTIDEVLDHYSSGIKPNANLDVKFKTPDGKVKFISLSDAERLALKAFLAALTDETMLTDPKYSDPFRRR